MYMDISDQEKQDQRRSCGMEDSTAMTVEFLRARLLSERSVSKSARQRADKLAGRVAELEEQLRFVSLQRMKAEKATAYVLAILESNGMSDVSETFDSDSCQDSPCESKVGHRSTKEEENCVSSNMRRLESESGSDFDFPTMLGRNLSWRGRRDSPRSLDKFMDPSLRRRSGFASTGSSPRHLSGKSCRQIRSNGSRCTVCLAEYSGEDMLRILPYCGHSFHVTCIDLWLQQHCTCPVCRISLREFPDRKRVMQPLFSSALRTQYGTQSCHNGLASRAHNSLGADTIQENHCTITEGNEVEGRENVSSLTMDDQTVKDSGKKLVESPSNP